MASRMHKDDIREDIKEVKEEAEQAMETIAESAGRYARRAVEETKHLAESGDHLVAAIREEPLKAMLVALGAGVVLGALLRR